DVGVAGVHRLLDRKEEIKKAKVLIVCAGFEGALPTVVGGLFPQPIIAVPISIGYGVAKGGHTALNSMLSSCANGLLVTNIDNGYGAAIAAYRIVKGLR
ncbi:MAG: AIR carboxylase family protein, partial [Ignavibacteriae bacterium]|nr:AIR carboxylase family protein [Ignavibacteriota bacterium]